MSKLTTKKIKSKPILDYDLSDDIELCSLSKSTLTLSQKECINDNTDYDVVNWSEEDIIIINKFNPDDIHYIDTYGKTLKQIINDILELKPIL